MITGKKRGVVVDTRNPNGNMMVRVRIDGLNDGVPVENLPWAEYMLDLNFTFKPTKVGDLVWVEFPYDGDSQRPLVVGGAQSNFDGKPNVSGVASGQEPLSPPEGEGVPSFPSFDSTADMVYDRNNFVVVATADGGVILQSKSNGAVIFMNSGGDIALNSPTKVSIVGAGGIEMKTPSKFSLNADGGIELVTAGVLGIQATIVDAKQG